MLRGSQHVRPEFRGIKPPRGSAYVAANMAQERHLEVLVDPQRQELNHLVVVTGHAIWNGNSVEDAWNEDMWILEPYQKGKRSIEAFVQHVKRG